MKNNNGRGDTGKAAGVCPTLVSGAECGLALTHGATVASR